jgi:LDH2 family malate/lactate/ureidoglycolate dehydrogenase
MEKITINTKYLKEVTAEILQSIGVSVEDSAITADTLVTADQWGISSHGIFRLSRYVDCIKSGGIKPEAPFTIEKKGGPWYLASANGGLGIPASFKAVNIAIKTAQECVIGVVNVKCSHHNGAEGYYANLCADKNMAGMVMSTGSPIMAISGSAGKVIGNNPFSYGVPAGKFGNIVFDVAMSALADGKIQIARKNGRKLPLGCILDRNGNPSVNPEDYLDGGALLPFGSHKGYGFALMVEIFAGVLSGAGLLDEINSWNEDPGKCGNTGHLFIAFDIKQMLDYNVYISKIEEMAEKIKNSAKMPGVARILLPGEIEKENKIKSNNTIELSASSFESLQKAAEKAGIKIKAI